MTQKIKNTNKIIIAMDNTIPEGMRLIAKTCNNEGVYGYKIGSLWILDNGIEILKSVKDLLESKNSHCKIILDMQKWGTDIPSIVEKQVNKVAEYVDELIVCPMGGGKDTLQVFIDECYINDIKSICVLSMTQPNADSYLIENSAELIYNDAKYFGNYSYVIPATKDSSKLNFMLISDEKYATGFKTQGGQTKPMIDFGVTKFIVGRAIYEIENPEQAINDIIQEINGVE